MGTGPTNTKTIVKKQGDGRYAAKVCDDYTNAETGTGVYTDWYLPSINELLKLYLNKDKIGGFAIGGYWSSSEKSAETALNQYFGGGVPTGDSPKNTLLHVRAIRSF